MKKEEIVKKINTDLKESGISFEDYKNEYEQCSYCDVTEFLNRVCNNTVFDIEDTEDGYFIMVTTYVRFGDGGHTVILDYEASLNFNTVESLADSILYYEEEAKRIIDLVNK